MRFVDDEEISFCLTISEGITREVLLRVLRCAEEALPIPQTFDDRPDLSKPGDTGLMNVFTVDGCLVALENSGLVGVSYLTKKRLAEVPGSTKYVSIYYSGRNNQDCQFLQVEDGTPVADFSPAWDELPPSTLSQFFVEGEDYRHGMFRAAEHVMGVKIDPSWLTEKTETYLVNYKDNAFCW